jgi:hypothetical protein
VQVGLSMAKPNIFRNGQNPLLFNRDDRKEYISPFVHHGGSAFITFFSS